MSSDLPLELPPVKPWDKRWKSLPTLAGGSQKYLETLRWILEQCQGAPSKALLISAYRDRYELSENTARIEISDLRNAGFLQLDDGLALLTAPAKRWVETAHAEIAIGTLHANVRFIGELLHEIREPRTRKQLLDDANRLYALAWKSDQQVARRLKWLRSAGFAQLQLGHTYSATSAGLDFLKSLELHQPDITPPPDPPSPPQTVLSIPGRGNECAKRLRALAIDGARHKEFEEAVRDAFAFLGFEAQLLSGAGQTDVLVSGVRQPADGDDRSANRWRYRAVVDAKAVSKGKLTSGQVTWPAIEKHRKLHQAEYALLVGPEPSGQLLDFATSARIGVLAAELLAELVAKHALVPLPLPEYQALFADENDQPRGGTVDLVPIEAARTEHEHRRGLLVGAFRAVSNVAESGSATATAQVVQFALSQNGIASRLGDVDAALELLANPWLDAIGFRGERLNRDCLPTAAPRVVAARLRWLADAFDEAGDASAEPSSSD